MNKEVVIIGGGFIGGAVSGGISNLLPQESSFANIGVAAAAIFGATKVSGTTTKSNLLRGALAGVAVVQLLTAVKKAVQRSSSDPRFAEQSGKLGKFSKGVLGLACPHDEGGLNGQFMGADGNVYEMDESGLSGTFMDENGNVFEAADGLNGADSIYGQEDELGLNGAESDLEAELYS